MDRLLFDRYHDTIVAGALADLLLMRKHEFSDPQLALVYDKQFKAGVAQGKIDVDREFKTSAKHHTPWRQI